VTSRARPATILAIILTSYFMILLDNSVIFTGLPSIRAGLGLSATELSWVQDAYTLVFGGLLLLGARAGDLGLAFAPLTAAGISGVTAAEAGAASGLVNTFHQLGSALGLGILIAVSANASTVIGHVATALAGSAVFMAAALVIALVTITPRLAHPPTMAARVAAEETS